MAHSDYSPNIIDRSRDSYQPARKRLQPRDVLVRAATAELLRNQDGPDKWERVTDTIARHYGGCPATKAFIERAATNPATTTTATWAAELVDQSTIDFMAADMARVSGFAQLAQRALTIALEPGMSSIKIPSRSSPISLMGTWIGESAAKPVYAGSLTTSLLTPYKLAAVSVFSEEMMECTAIEQIVRETLVHDLSALLDTAIFDATAVSAGIRPSGLWNGATAVTPSALTPHAEAMMTDLRALAAAVTGTGNPDAIVAFVVNPAQAMRINLVAPDYGNLIVSGYQTAGNVGAVDVGGIAMLVGQPMFAVSNSAAIHMETSPLPLGTTGSPNVVAAPMSSAFQQDLVALRISLKTGWVKRRTAATALATAVIW